MIKKDLETQITEFLQFWDAQKLVSLYRVMFNLVDMFDIDDEDDWVKEAVGEENERNVRVLRMVYLISKLADFHAGQLVTTNIRFKNLWRIIEKNGLHEQEQINQDKDWFDK